MKISVVIPVYNEQKYIKNCLLSLKNQSVQADEIIVVDNNSSDKTIFIARKFGVCVIKEKKQSITCTRNKGFNMAKYEIIARCDGDTILPIDWIERIKYNFLTFGIDALTGPSFFYDFPIKTSLYCDAAYHINSIFFGYKILNGNNLAITKDIWNKVKNNTCTNDQSIHEDMDLAIHIAKAGGKIRRDNKLRSATSARRIKMHPLSSFVEYPFRGFTTHLQHYDDTFIKRVKLFLYALYENK